jgi:hypothetical protein
MKSTDPIINYTSERPENYTEHPNGASYTSKQEVTEISFKEIILRMREWWKFLLSKGIIILFFMFSGCAIGFSYAYLQKPNYIAKLTFALEDDNAGGSSAYSGIAGQFGINLGGGAQGGVFSGNNLLALMKSRSMVEKSLLNTIVIDGKNRTIADFYIEISNLREKWADIPEYNTVEFKPGVDYTSLSLTQNTILRDFYSTLTTENLEVEREEENSSIISVKVKSINELFSKYFTEALVKEVTEFYIESKTKKSMENLSILQNQTDSIKNFLNASIGAVAASIDANPNANPAKQTLRVPSQRRQADVQANQLILTELVKNLEATKMSVMKETPFIQVIDRPILPLSLYAINRLQMTIVCGLVAGFLAVVGLIIKRLLENL